MVAQEKKNIKLNKHTYRIQSPENTWADENLKME